MKFIKDYDFGLKCHPKKANVMVDVLSMKNMMPLEEKAKRACRSRKRNFFFREEDRVLKFKHRSNKLDIHPKATKMLQYLEKMF
jgi:hypothetical protein